MINNLESTSICDIKYKIVFLGNMSVGKSSIIQRFTYGNFDDHRQDTVGIDFLSKNLHYGGRLYRLLLWDTAGQEKFRSLIPAYLRDAQCAVFVYDVTSSQSFLDLRNWINLFNNYKRKNAAMLIVGNKIDLKQKRTVAPEEAYEYATQSHIGYSEVSAKKGQRISTLFQTIIDRIQATEDKHEPGFDDIEKQPPPSSERLESNSESRINKKLQKEGPEALAGRKKVPCCSI